MGVQQQRAKIGEGDLAAILAQNPSHESVSKSTIVSGNIVEMPLNLARSLQKQLQMLQEKDGKEREVIFRQSIKTGELFFEFQLLADHPDHKLLGQLPTSKMYKFSADEELVELNINPKYFPMGLPETMFPVCRIKRDGEKHSVGVSQPFQTSAENYSTTETQLTKIDSLGNSGEETQQNQMIESNKKEDQAELDQETSGEKIQQNQMIENNKKEYQAEPDQANLETNIKPSISITLQAKQEKKMDNFNILTDPVEIAKFIRANEVDMPVKEARQSNNDRDVSEEVIVPRALVTQKNKPGPRSDNDVWFRKALSREYEEDPLVELLPSQMAEMMGYAPKVRLLEEGKPQNNANGDGESQPQEDKVASVLLSKSVRTEGDLDYKKGDVKPLDNMEAGKYWEQYSSAKGFFSTIVTEVAIGKEDSRFGRNRTMIKGKEGSRVATYDFGINQEIFSCSSDKVEGVRGLSYNHELYHTAELALIVSHFHEMTPEQKSELFAAIYAARSLAAENLDHLPCVVSGQVSSEKLAKAKEFFAENQKTFVDLIIERPEDVGKFLEISLGQAYYSAEESLIQLAPAYAEARSKVEERILKFDLDDKELLVFFGGDGDKVAKFKDKLSKMKSTLMKCDSRMVDDLYWNPKIPDRMSIFFQDKDEPKAWAYYMKKLNDDPEIKEGIKNLLDGLDSTREVLGNNGSAISKEYLEFERKTNQHLSEQLGASKKDHEAMAHEEIPTTVLKQEGANPSPDGSEVKHTSMSAEENTQQDLSSPTEPEVNSVSEADGGSNSVPEHTVHSMIDRYNKLSEDKDVDTRPTYNGQTTAPEEQPAQSDNAFLCTDLELQKAAAGMSGAELLSGLDATGKPVAKGSSPTAEFSMLGGG